MRPIRKLSRFRPSEILAAINDIIDALNALRPRYAPGVKTSTSSKGVTRAAAKQQPQIVLATETQPPKARWG